MINFLFLMGFGFFCVLIQTNLFLNQYIFPFKPDLTIPLTVYIGLSQTPIRGGVAVLGIGCLMDVASGGLGGLYVFMREVIFFLTLFLKKTVVLENKLLYSLLITLFFLTEALFVYIIYKFVGSAPVGVIALLRVSFLRSLFSLLLWVCIWPLFSIAEKRVNLF